MDFLKDQKKLEFLYDGIPFEKWNPQITEKQTEGGLITEYLLPDGLKVTNLLIRKGDALEWVNWFENTSSRESRILSEIWDCSVTLPLPYEDYEKWMSCQPAFEDVTTVYAPNGSVWAYDEFCSFPDRKEDNLYTGQILPGMTKEYASYGGRSSDGNAPFFHVHKKGTGYIFGIGWTGQWNCKLQRTKTEIQIKTKIEDTCFRLYPGEKIRTSSIVIMPYEGSVRQAQNKWRRLIKEHYSLIGKEGRDMHGPLCISVWGGWKTEQVLERIRNNQEKGLPFEYVWMDAGWYGRDTRPTKDDYDPGWSVHVGDWQVSPLIHPNGLKDVSEAVHAAGMKFLLWFEPERVLANTPMVKEHPEYFLFPEEADDPYRLLNLGDPKAWDYCFTTLAGLIEEIGIDCYRQDFNFPPLPYFRRADAEDRKGISEIKHIMGLYRLWDALLEKFPHLLIDNCASGGRRIDMETLRRSIPLWRSDYECPVNYPAEGVQCHHFSYSNWLPYSGTGTGGIADNYHIRSSYSPALTVGYAMNGDAWLKKRMEEYKKVRPFLSEDFYPLTETSDRKDVWMATQFDRPSRNDGLVQVFCRENSPYETAKFKLNGLDKSKNYIFTDADDDSKISIQGEVLTEQGFSVTIKERPCAKLYFYETDSSKK